MQRSIFVEVERKTDFVYNKIMNGFEKMKGVDIGPFSIGSGGTPVLEKNSKLNVGRFKDFKGPLADQMNQLPIEAQNKIDYSLNDNGLTPDAVQLVRDPKEAEDIINLMRSFVAESDEAKRRRLGREIAERIDGSS